MKDIIIFGEMGSGKDEVARILSDVLNVYVIKLGKRIREDVDSIHPLLPDGLNKRKLYQDYGEGMRQIFGEDVWNLILHNDIRPGIEKGHSHIIADGRQEHELTYWTKLGFVPVGITANEAIRVKRLKERDGFDQSQMFDHKTEKAVREVVRKIELLEPTGDAFLIRNNGTLDELKTNVIQVAIKISQRFTVGSL
ncbi:AAA family ATPase [Bacillus atrophaeus]|uniref:AAA family ATPase n=1 Tax=Bacillus atrophaeus TaxID=1452 RepID=UPI002E1C1016|nr:AAA family ATPase [Bacillus atrophaeus]